MTKACIGCKKRCPGCKNTCIEYVVSEIVQQPEKERMEKEKMKHIMIEYDRERRINHMKNANIAENSPTKCRKR
jgi:pyruvate-formate lyase-activating enzyme